MGLAGQGHPDKAGWGVCLDGTAEAISKALNPLFLAAASVITLIYVLEGLSPRSALEAGVSVTFCTLLPMRYVASLMARGLTDGPFIPDRSRRVGPLLVTSGSCLAGSLTLYALSAPSEVCGLVLCHVVSSISAAALSLRWKVSLHAVGAWVPLVAFVLLFGGTFLILAPVPVVVCWARLRVGAHSVGQVAAGSGLGLLCTTLVFFTTLGVLPPS